MTLASSADGEPTKEPFTSRYELVLCLHSPCTCRYIVDKEQRRVLDERAREARAKRPRREAVKRAGEATATAQVNEEAAEYFYMFD